VARPADERSALRIFIGTGRFSNKHYARVGAAFTRHGVCPQGTQAAFAALTNFPGDFFKFSGFLGDSHIILLFLRFRLPCLASESKTSQKLLHFKVLANDFVNIHLFSHRDEL
jgi:hypothetical protein